MLAVAIQEFASKFVRFIQGPNVKSEPTALMLFLYILVFLFLHLEMCIEEDSWES